LRMNQLRKPIVAIIGRPNVGKSSLFNRLIRNLAAVVNDSPGITRDRNYAETEWNGRAFIIVDTGGYVLRTRDRMELMIRQQVQAAIDEADMILFLVDVSVGITDLDLEIARILQKGGRQCLLAVNKVDTFKQEPDVAQFYNLGLGEPIPVSALTGRNSGDLLDAIVQYLPEQEELQEEEEEGIKVAILGRPNVGKSSFVNTLLGQERMIVDETPGTTRDSIDTKFEHNGKKFVLIDTAGLRKRSRIKEQVEFYSSLRALRSLQRCDVALVLSDVTDGLVTQDKKILSQTNRFGKGIVLAVNKWDLIKGDADEARRLSEQVGRELISMNYVPVIYTSALTGENVHESLALICSVYDNWGRKVPTSHLNRFLSAMRGEGRLARSGVMSRVRLVYGTQKSTRPPTFIFFANRPDLIDDGYRRYVENRLREEFGFEGTPIRLLFRRK